jgi:TonB family protein
MRRGFWLGLVVAVASSGLAAVSGSVSRGPTATLEQRERQMWKALTRNSQFSDVLHVAASSRCEDVQPPQALATPNPLLMPVRDRLKVRVSFIIGTDGKVHSPLILESAGPTGDRNVLRTVRTWKYRPATCNGVPTETEGKVEFSSR